MGVRIRTETEIKKATRYKDIFSNNKDIAKKEYREYCKLYHPDSNNSDLARELFDKISKIYNEGTTEIEVKFINKSTGKGFILTNPVIIQNGIGTVYHTDTKVAITMHKTYEKFFKNYINNVKQLKYKDKEMEKEFKRYFPDIVNSFLMEDDNYCILLNKTKEVLNLGKILDSYKAKGELFPEKQAAWILNRLYNLSCYMQYNGWVFNGFDINNVWVSPEYHAVLLLDGWQYKSDIGDGLFGCPKDVYKVMPIKIKTGKTSETGTDIESIRAIGRKLFAGHKGLKYINKFLDSAVNKYDSWEDWNLYQEALTAEFGDRKFIVWDNVPYN